MSGSVCGKKNFNVAVSSDIINMINVKLCMTVGLMELYPFILLSVTLIAFHVKQFELKMLCFYPSKLKHFTIVDYVKHITNIPLFFFFQLRT